MSRSKNSFYRKERNAQFDCGLFCCLIRGKMYSKTNWNLCLNWVAEWSNAEVWIWWMNEEAASQSNHTNSFLIETSQNFWDHSLLWNWRARIVKKLFPFRLHSLSFLRHSSNGRCSNPLILMKRTFRLWVEVENLSFSSTTQEKRTWQSRERIFTVARFAQRLKRCRKRNEKNIRQAKVNSSDKASSERLVSPSFSLIFNSKRDGKKRELVGNICQSRVIEVLKQQEALQQKFDHSLKRNLRSK